MKAVVFGGSGFLGSHIADELTNRGYQVSLFDSRSSPYLKAGQEMIVGDIMDAEQVVSAIKGFDFVYNFAGIADLDDATTKPYKTAQLNILGNLNILDACIKERVSRFVYASTIYVYSQKGGFYRCSKQASELYIEEFHRKYGLEYTILRYGTLYGPRADERNSVYRYLKQAMEGQVIRVSGTGEEIREYISVHDASRLSVDILDAKYAGKNIILSGHYPMKLKEMLMLIREITGRPVDIVFSGEASADHYSYTPYSYLPKAGEKLVNHLYLDLGQGLLESLQDMYKNEC